LKGVALPYRLNTFKSLAKLLKLKNEEFDTLGIDELLSEFYLFRKTRGYIHGLMTSNDLFQEQLYIFDFYYSRIAPFDTITTAFFIHSKNLSIPQFILKPETFFHQVASVLGYDDIDFEEHPEFSANYYLKSPDEEKIRQTFNDKMIHYFSLDNNWVMEAHGYYLLIYRENMKLERGDLKNFYKDGKKIYKHLKKFSY